MDLSNPDGTGKVTITNVTISEKALPIISRDPLRVTVLSTPLNFGEPWMMKKLEAQWKVKQEFYMATVILSHRH